MVNKQYNVQSLNKKSNRSNQHNSSASSSPTSVSPATPRSNRNVTVISSIPNPHNQYNINNLNALSTDILNSAHHQQKTVYGRNISYRNDGFDLVDNCDNNKISNVDDEQNELTINDIGRFQYILQMDREMVSETKLENKI